jgi:3-oxoacyl-[acyl-carrier protein] reductase
VTVDVTSDSAGDHLLAAAEQDFGALDVLVNNAGAAAWHDLDEVTDAEWRAAYELNVMAPLRLMRAAIPPMEARGWGRVVNVCSTAGKRPSAAMPEYSVAKAAELSLSRLFADRHAASGVLVNAICPGPVESEMWMEPGGLLDQSRELEGGLSREEALGVAGAKRPIGRLAEPAEIAAAIVFLCSARASYVAGAAWSVDGGTVQVII